MWDRGVENKKENQKNTIQASSQESLYCRMSEKGSSHKGGHGDLKKKKKKPK